MASKIENLLSKGKQTRADNLKKILELRDKQKRLKTVFGKLAKDERTDLPRIKKLMTEIQELIKERQKEDTKLKTEINKLNKTMNIINKEGLTEEAKNMLANEMRTLRIAERETGKLNKREEKLEGKEDITNDEQEGGIELVKNSD